MSELEDKGSARAILRSDASSGASPNPSLLACPFCGSSKVSVHRLKARREVMCDDCDCAGPLMDDAQNAVAAWNRRAAPSGWVLVPREPTEEMCAAYTEAEWNSIFMDPLGAFCDGYQAMLSAAPASPESDPTGVWRNLESLTVGGGGRGDMASVAESGGTAQAPKSESPRPLGKSAAQVAYERHTDNHPTIHSNRFPAWSELSREQRIEWTRRAASAEVGRSEP